MNESLTNASDKLGFPPGSLVHVGSVISDQTTISVIDYCKDSWREHTVSAIDEVLQFRGSDKVTWVIVEGLVDVSIVARLGDMFQIHQLVLEDILNTHQRPKFEEYDECLFIVLKGLLVEQEKFAVIYEQISMLLVENFVFTFKEKKDELFRPVLQRIKTSKGRFRSLGPDFLAYSILDVIVDQNFLLIDSLDYAIAAVEASLVEDEPGRQTLNDIQLLRRETVSVRRYISPVRDVISEMLRSESPLIDVRTHVYLRDVSDHAIRILESIEIHREILAGLMEVYVSTVSNKMNEVMKVLTIFASIFIPLTFLTGIYGMNFDHMPELKWHWAYPALWLVFIAIPVSLLVYFRRKRWL